MKTRGEDFDWSFEMVLIWARYLTKKAITKTEFEVAEEKSFDDDWMPNNAQEFLALARKSSQPTYPPATEAFDNACSQSGLIEDKYVKRQWLHDVVQLTAHRIGMGRLKTADHKFLNYFKKIYEQVCNEHEAGTLFLIPEERQLAHSHQPVELGSEADKRISEQLAELQRMAV